MPARSKSATLKDSAATIGFEAKLWHATDKLRNNTDAPEPSGARKTAKGSIQGKRWGFHPYYTAICFLRCQLEMLASYVGRIYGPVCCSGCIFVQSLQIVGSGFNPVLLAA
jgi:hypothetical protein